MASTKECDMAVNIRYDDRKWPWFILTPLIIYGSGLVLIIIGRILLYFIQHRKAKVNSVDMDEIYIDEELKQGWYLDFKERAGNLISGQTIQGRLLVVASFIINLAACALYITESSYPIEHCFNGVDILWKIEVCFNLFFIFHFIIRFLAANDKLFFWTGDILTYIDILTVPTIFVSVILKRNWLGLRFLRVIYMVNLSDILQFLNVLRGGTNVEMVDMVGTFLAVWLSSAGMVHLLENTGDPWHPINYHNNRTINYFDSTYFLLVTMSTVGYGDIYCMTYLGRIFCMMFIGVGLGLFASYLPAISTFFAALSKYNRDFKPTPGKRHVIVAGNITEESVASFAKDFLHPDREDNQTIVIFLSPIFPSVSLQAVLKRYETRTLYFVGTIYSTADCARMAMRQADAVIILCNKKCTNPDEEDAANITRVISVKNYHESMRCIVQLMMNKNKSNLMNCPQWNPDLGDDIVCISELKLGFIAQSCNAPGFSTLLANLFGMRSNTISEAIQESEQWKVAYMIGAGNELYTATLSDSFINMTFPQAVELCYEKLDLMMIAIEMKISTKERYFAVNPNDRTLKLLKNTRGFFFAQDANDVSRVSKYCSICHRDLIDPERMGKCGCRSKRRKELEELNKKSMETKVDMDPVHLLQGIDDDKQNYTRPLTDDHYPNGDKPLFDQSGTFYWCETRSYSTAKLSLVEARNQQFKDHVVVLVLSTRHSPSLELRQLVLPLRASNNVPASLKKVVILGDGDFLQREWHSLENFPNVDIVPGAPYNRSDLRAVNVSTANMVILLSPGHIAGDFEHQALSDKEVILVTLNLKAMKFDQSKLHIPQTEKVTDLASLLPTTSRINTPKSVSDDAQSIPPKSRPQSVATLRSLGSSQITIQRLFTTNGQTGKAELKTCNIPIITELAYDSNAMYLDQDDMNIYDADGIYLSQPYACGSAFNVSVLDSLVSATYFNSDILTLVRNIVTGSVSSELDEILSEGMQPTGSYETPEIAAVRNRCRIGQVSLSDGLLSEFGECGLFGDLFLYALRTYDMICLGLYRYRDTSKQNPNAQSKKRYVITFPAFNFMLAPTDLVFVLMQFESGKKKKRGIKKKVSVFM